MRCRFAALLCVVVFTTSFLLADEKVEKAEKKKPTGTWIKESDGHKITIEVKTNTLTLTVDRGEDVRITVDASYAVASDGTLFAYITNTTKKGAEGGPEKKDMFCFEFSVKKDEMTLSNLKGNRVSEGAAKVIEGSYTKK